jgi:selenocysteine lyase/cysteine desulfurase
MELMEEIGIAETQRHVRKLNELLIEGVDELGGTLATPRDPNRHGALICIRSTDAARLVDELAQEGIVTSSRDGNLRVSAHAYNTPEDVKAVLWELARKRHLLA